MEDASQLYSEGGFVIDPWTGNVVADPSAIQANSEAALTTLSDPLSQAAQQALYSTMGVQQATANGQVTDPLAQVTASMTDPLYSDELVQQLYDTTIEEIMPAVNSTFATEGMTGSSLHEQNLTKALSSGISGVEQQLISEAEARALEAANAYEAATSASRAQSLQASGMVPELTQGVLDPYRQSLEVGQAQSDRAQAELDYDVLLHSQEQAKYIDALNNYLALTSGLGASYGSSSSTASQDLGVLGLLSGLTGALSLF
jgi:hypothetical protein